MGVTGEGILKISCPCSDLAKSSPSLSVAELCALGLP